MKIIKTEKIRPNLADTKTWKEITQEDIFCDICDESCENREESEACDKKSFSFLELKASWGYFSDWDGENWQSHICAECIKAHILPLVKINVRDYMYGNVESGVRENGVMKYND